MRSRESWLALTVLVIITLTVAALTSDPARAADAWYLAPGGDDSSACTCPSTFGAAINGPIGTASGGDMIPSTRTARLGVEPYLVYLPRVVLSYCPLLYADDFSDPGSGWPVSDGGIIRREYLDGEYRILVREPWWVAISRSPYKASDYLVAVDLLNERDVFATYGLVLGLSDDWTQFYTLEIDHTGHYMIMRYEVDSGWTRMAFGWSSHIKYSRSTNRLAIERDGLLLNAYANGQFLTSVADGSFTGLRHMGLFVSAWDWGNVDVRFDSFAVYPVGCGACGTAPSAVPQETPELGLESPPFVV